MKNIPVPSKKVYLKILIDKIELLIKGTDGKHYFLEMRPKVLSIMV